MVSGQMLNQIVQGLRGAAPGGLTMDDPTTTTDADGTKTTRSALVHSADPAIRIGSWELRLLPTAAGADGSLRIPVELVEGADGRFRALTIEVGRLELVCDRSVFIPGSLVAEPFQHIVAVSDPNARVRLFGPGVRLRFAGDDLSDVSVEARGAEGASSAELPSLRFDPPHFLIAGDTVGIACDEAVLDLRTDVSPGNVPVAPGADANAWKGLFLKELGVFINNGSQAGSGDWAGNAVLRNFFIGFEPVELSGTFRAELIHLVPDGERKVVIDITHPTDGGGTTVTRDSDVNLPAPPAGSASRRVELRATATWDSEALASGSLRARWTVPAAAHVEDGYRVERMNLGAVLLPPGSHTFTIEVTDDRLPVGERAQTATRTIIVAGVPAGDVARPLVVTADAERPLADGNRPRQRLHLGVPVGQGFTVRAVARGGAGNVDFAAAVATGGVSTATVNPTGVARDASGAAAAQWQFTAGSAPGDFVVEVTATAGGATARHRIRGRVEAAESPGAPRFDLSSYTDARPDPGIVQALVEVANGTGYDDIAWSLEERAAPDDLFRSDAHDGLFAEGSAGWTDTGLRPTLSAGAVRAFLPESKLYRLSGRRGGTSAATPRPTLMIAGRPLRSGEVTALSASIGSMQLPGAPVPGGVDFLFPYDSSAILPASITREGPEDPSLRKTAAQIRDAQRDALAALFRAVLTDPTAVARVHVCGQASIEGREEHNMSLGTARATAASHELTGAGPLPTAAMAEIAAEFPGKTLADVHAALAGKIAVHSVGEAGSRTVHVAASGAQSPDPSDRRVYFLVERSPAPASSSDLVRREYFVVRRDAEVVPSTVRTPARPLQQHPFRHNCFRKATTEIELLRNRIMKFQVVLVVDLEAFNENDADPRQLNDADGITTFFLEYKENPAPAAGEPKFSWELAALADPRDADGLIAATNATVRQALGGPLIAVPAITAVSGGEIGAGAFVAAATVGAILSGVGFLAIDFLCLSGVRLRVRYGDDAGTELRFAVDYKLKYRIHVDIPGVLELKTDQPIELGFRNVGVEIREGRDVKFFYKPDEGFALDVRDPGVFQLGEGLGRLLRVDRVRLGAGSPLWFEVELGFAFETGIFSVDTLRIRVSFDTDKLFPTSGDVTLSPAGFSAGDFDVAINKLGVSVDVPGVLAGAGTLEMSREANGMTIAGTADVEIVPLKFGVSASAKFVQRSQPRELTAFFGALGVEFSPGLPLGTTGVALQGLEGLLGVNMGRTKPAPEQALEWYMQSPVGATSPDKWDAAAGRWAIGAGAVLGTVYDAGFTFNLKGLFMLELPGPKFTLAANANLIKAPPALGDASEQGTITALVMLDFENDVFLIGLDFRYKIPHLLDLHVPVEAFFNLRSARDWHIRFGQWEPASKRISIRVLEMWNASGYIQIEGDRLQNSRLDLLGPAVGLGSRVEISWGARPIVWFEAFLEWHVGVQFKPLLVMGSIEVGGSLHLGPFSIGGRGRLTIRAPEPLVIQGEVCGEIDLWLFSIEGCASISIGAGDPTPPAPESPFSDVAILDRWTDRAIATVQDGTTRVEDVPIDAVLHVNFTSDVRDERPTPASAAFADTWRNQVSSALFYEFALRGLSLAAGGAPMTGFDQTWPGISLPDKTGPAAAEAKGHRTLRLLSWLPHAHARAVDFSAGYATTLWSILKGLCEPTPPPTVRCLTLDEEAPGYRASWKLTDCALATSWVINSRTAGLGSEAFQTDTGTYAARVVPLPAITWDGQAARHRALELGPGWPRLTLPDLLPQAAYPPTDKAPPLKLDVERLLDREAAAHVLEKLRKVEVAPHLLVDDAALSGKLVLEVAELHRVEARVAEAWHLTKGAGVVEAAEGMPVVEAFAAPQEEGASFVEVFAGLLKGKAAPLSKRASAGVLGFYVGGLVWVAMQDLLEARATFLVPDRIQDGEVVFLDARLRPVGFVHRLATAPTVASSAIPGYRVVAVTQAADLEEKRRLIRWMAILPPSRVAAVQPAVSEDALRRMLAPPRQASLGASYFLQLCGRTFAEWTQWQEREADRLRSITLLKAVGGVGGANPGGLDGELLQPDTEYTLTTTIDWRRYPSASGPESGSGSFGEVTVARFRTAREAPASLAPYIAGHEPASDEQPHYTEEGLRFDFKTRSVDEIWRRFGKQLVIRAKADLGGEVFLQPVDTAGGDGFVEIGSPEFVWNEAMTGGVVPCLLDATVQSGSSVKTSKKFAPNTGYTISVHARPLNEGGAVGSEEAWDQRLLADLVNDGEPDAHGNRVVYRFAMQTSRHADFVAHVEAYRAQTPVDLIGDGAGALPTASAREDAAVDALCAALLGGPLELPRGPEVVRLWRAGPSSTPYGAPSWTFVGVLLDGPEPLLRRLSDGQPRVSAQVCAGAAFEASQAIAATQVVGARGSRVFLLFSRPPAAAHVTIRLLDRGPTGTGSFAQDLVIPVGDRPAAYQE